MSRAVLQASGVAKAFNRREIFSEINFSVDKGGALAITGRNGSGKSTLLKILAGVLAPSQGTIKMYFDGSPIKAADKFAYVGFVSPYLQLYDEFTGWENLDIVRKIRGIDAPDTLLSDLLRRVNLFDRCNDFVRTYSSGMKQRLKYAFALIHQPPVLLLDEPTSNLDAEGVSTVYQIMREQKERGILVVATNDAEEIMLCEQFIDLSTRKGEVLVK